MAAKQYKKGIAIAGSLALLIGLGFSYTEWNKRKTLSPHYVDLACGVCHEYEKGTCTSADCTQCHDPATSTVNYYTRLKAGELELCTSCHEREGEVEVRNFEGRAIKVDLGVSHPWGLIPSDKSRPASLPLSPDGLIVCTTCHDVHTTNRESRMLRLYVAREGKDEDFTVLCYDCHPGY